MESTCTCTVSMESRCTYQWSLKSWFQVCGYPLQDDEGSSSGQVNFDWNPYADCKEFSFYDQGFLDKIKDGHTVSCLYWYATTWMSMHVNACCSCRTLKSSFESFPCATQFCRKTKMVHTSYVYATCTEVPLTSPEPSDIGRTLSFLNISRFVVFFRLSWYFRMKPYWSKISRMSHIESIETPLPSLSCVSCQLATKEMELWKQLVV